MEERMVVEAENYKYSSNWPHPYWPCVQDRAGTAEPGPSGAMIMVKMYLGMITWVEAKQIRER